MRKKIIEEKKEEIETLKNNASLLEHKNRFTNNFFNNNFYRFPDSYIRSVRETLDKSASSVNEIKNELSKENPNFSKTNYNLDEAKRGIEKLEFINKDYNKNLETAINHPDPLCGTGEEELNKKHSYQEPDTDSNTPDPGSPARNGSSCTGTGTGSAPGEKEDPSNFELSGIVEKINKSSLFYWSQDWFEGLSGIQKLAFSLIISKSVFFSCLVNILFIFYGDKLIIRYNIEKRYPKLAQLIKLRRKFQSYYLIYNFSRYRNVIFNNSRSFFWYSYIYNIKILF